jgi:hypothetical protein
MQKNLAMSSFSFSPLLPLPVFFILTTPFSFVASTPASVWQRNLDLVKSISPRQRVETNTALEVECELDQSLPLRAELAWVKVERGGWETLLSYYTSKEGVENFIPGITGDLDRKRWRLTFHRVNSSHTGFYQCQVFLHHQC